MKCPYCEKDMVRGYIQCRDGVTWTPKEQIFAALSSFGRGSISIENGAAGNSETVFAYKCGNCKKIIIEYN